MVRCILLTFILLVVPKMSAQTQLKVGEKNVTPVTSDTLVQGWQTGVALTSIIREGFASNIPVGIVLEGDSLCRSNISGHREGGSIALLIKQIERDIPDYTAEVKNQVLYIHPRSIRASTLNALELRIPVFHAEPVDAQDDGISLWMYIRAILVPQQASMFSGGTQKNAETLPAFSLSNVSVQDVLDRLITLGQGGIWIMNSVPPEWQSDPATIPYDIISYAGEPGPALHIKCLDLK